MTNRTLSVIHQTSMIRTQIYLPESLHQSIELLSKRRKRSKAELIRNLLEKGLTQEELGGGSGVALLDLVKIKARGPRNLSVKIDEALYGK